MVMSYLRNFSAVQVFSSIIDNPVRPHESYNYNKDISISLQQVTLKVFTWSSKLPDFITGVPYLYPCNYLQ